MLNKPNYAFIDSQNLYLGVQSEGWVLDYAKIRIDLLKQNLENIKHKATKKTEISVRSKP